MSHNKFIAINIGVSTIVFACILAFMLHIGVAKLSLRNGPFFILMGGIVSGLLGYGLATYYTRQIQKIFPGRHSFWEIFPMFFLSYWSTPPKSELGDAIAQRLTFFRINTNAFVAIVFFAFLVLGFSGWFRAP
jgi:hypothetical protein